jgi:tartrate dehydratase beta subunit/fumarate hydratase class I family protein
MKSALKLSLVLGVIILTAAAVDTCRDVKKQAARDIAEIRNEYEAFKAVALAKQEILDAAIAAEQKKASEALEEADRLRDVARQRQAKIDEQAVVIAALQAAEPPTTPEIEAMPIVISLRAQLKEAVRGFSLAREAVATLEAENVSLRVAIDAKDKAFADMAAKWELERGLRLTAEKSFDDLSKKYSRLHTKITLKQVASDLLFFGLGYISGR